MTGGPPPHPPDLSWARRWRRTLSDPAVVAIASYSLLALAAAVTAYFALFTQFAPYDDEGTLLVTLKAFAAGDTLYSDIYTPYGPFFYELFGGFFALTGVDVTTEASRTIVLLAWIGTSLIFGIVSQVLTGRLALGITGAIAAFSTLFVLAGEPMHPQVLCVPLLGAFALLVVLGPGRRPAWIGAAGGGLLAALVLTKLNLGVFAVAAVAVAAALTVGPLWRRRWVRWPAITAAVLLPVFLMARDLGIDWVRNLMAMEVLAIAAVLVAASTSRPRPSDRDTPVAAWILGAAAGFAVAFVTIMAAIVLNGSSLADVYDGMVTEAMRVREVNMTTFPMPAAAVDWGIAALAGAAICVLLRARGSGSPALWAGLLRIAAGVVIWLTVSRIVPFALNPSSGNPDTIPALLAWVAVLAPVGRVETPYRRFLRTLLPTLAVFQTLQVYPVAGSQMGIAALTFVPVGALCIGDGLRELRAWAGDRGEQTLWRLGVVATVASIALAADFAVSSIVRPAASKIVAYRDQKPLPFAGAEALRLPQAEVDTYARLVDLLHSNRCTTFIGFPNIDSFYIWSGIDAPPPQAPGAWIDALDASRQQRIVDELRASPRPCAIRSYSRAENWLAGQPAPDRPLTRYIFDRFRPVETVGEFEFMLPAGSGGAAEQGTDAP